VLLPKHHAEAGRVSLYYGYFYFTAVADPPQGVKVGHVPEEEKSSGARREPKHHIGKRGQSLPTVREQA